MLRQIISRHISVKKCNTMCYSLSKEQNEQKISRSNYENRRSSVDLSVETDNLFSVLPDTINEMLDEHLIYHHQYPEVRERYSKFLNYMLKIDPKYLSAAIVPVHSYRLLEKSSLLTEESLKNACVLAWCHRMINASILVIDDIADRSPSRYNKPTWHTLDGIGVDAAMLDSNFVLSGLNCLVTNHFRGHPQFINIQKHLFFSAAYTYIAQTCEVKQYRLDEMEKHQNFPKFYIALLTPVTSALYLANIDDKRVHSASERMCIDISNYLKITDDMICVYNPDDPKQNTDISEGRTSWLVIEAYRRSNQSQRQLLEKHYGKNNKTSVAIVYNIFNELQLLKVYETFKEEFYEETYAKIHQELPAELPKKLYINLLDYAMSGNFRV